MMVRRLQTSIARPSRPLGVGESSNVLNPAVSQIDLPLPPARAKAVATPPPTRFADLMAREAPPADESRAPRQTDAPKPRGDAPRRRAEGDRDAGDAGADAPVKEDDAGTDAGMPGPTDAAAATVMPDPATQPQPPADPSAQAVPAIQALVPPHLPAAPPAVVEGSGAASDPQVAAIGAVAGGPSTAGVDAKAGAASAATAKAGAETPPAEEVILPLPAGSIGASAKRSAAGAPAPSSRQPADPSDGATPGAADAATQVPGRTAIATAAGEEAATAAPSSKPAAPAPPQADAKGQDTGPGGPAPGPDAPAPPVPADPSRPPVAAGPAVVQQPMLAPAVQVAQIGVTIATRVKQGESRFQIRLDPPELGRIDVSLSVDKAGVTNTVLTVERMDTLDLLQRDSRALERSLATAGFKADPGSLQFNLRDPGQNPQGFAGQNPDGGHSRRFVFAQAGSGPDDRRTIPTPVVAGLYSSSATRLGGLDIKV